MKFMVIIMNVFILEGIIDVVFVKSLLEHHFSVGTVPTAHDKKFQRGINILRRKLLNPKEYHYIKTNFGIIVYGDNGKQTIIYKVLPRIVQDMMGKIPEELKFLVILDEDGVPLNKTIEKIQKEIISRAIPNTKIQPLGDSPNELSIVSTVDESYKLRIHVYLIPYSLERQIVSKGVDFIRIPSRNRGELLNDDPHNALEKIAETMKVSKDELIQRSVTEKWFEAEPWYNNLLAVIERFLDDIPV